MSGPDFGVLVVVGVAALIFYCVSVVLVRQGKYLPGICLAIFASMTLASLLLPKYPASNVIPSFRASETNSEEDQLTAEGVVTEIAENGETATYFVIVTLAERPENFLMNRVCAVTGRKFKIGDHVQVTQIQHHSTYTVRWEETWFAEKIEE